MIAALLAFMLSDTIVITPLAPLDSVIGTFITMPVTNTVQYSGSETPFPEELYLAFEKQRITWQDYLTPADAYYERVWFANLLGYDPSYTNRDSSYKGWRNLPFLQEPAEADLRNVKFEDFYNAGQLSIDGWQSSLDDRDFSGMWRITVSNAVRALQGGWTTGRYLWNAEMPELPVYWEGGDSPSSSSLIGAAYGITFPANASAASFFAFWRDTISHVRSAISSGALDTLAFLASATRNIGQKYFTDTSSIYPLDGSYPGSYTVALSGGIMPLIHSDVVQRVFAEAKDIPVLFTNKFVAASYKTLQANLFRIDPKVLEVVNVPLVLLDQTHYAQPSQNYQAYFVENIDNVQVTAFKDLIVDMDSGGNLTATPDEGVYAGGYEATRSTVTNINEFYASLDVDINFATNHTYFIVPVWVSKSLCIDHAEYLANFYGSNDVGWVFYSKSQPHNPDVDISSAGSLWCQVPFTNNVTSAGTQVRVSRTKVDRILGTPTLGQPWYPAQSAPSLAPARSAWTRINTLDLQCHAIMDASTLTLDNGTNHLDAQTRDIAINVADGQPSHNLFAYKNIAASIADSRAQSYSWAAVYAVDGVCGDLSGLFWSYKDPSNLVETVKNTMKPDASLEEPLTGGEISVSMGAQKKNGAWKFYYGDNHTECPEASAAGVPLPVQVEGDTLLGVGVLNIPINLTAEVVAPPESTNFNFHVRTEYSKRVTWDFKALPIDRE